MIVYAAAAFMCFGILTAMKMFRKTKRYYNKLLTITALFTASVLYLQHRGW